MKNYELIAELSKLPAGAEVSFEAVCEADQVELQEEIEPGEDVFVVTRKISEVYMENERICLG